MKMNIKSRLLIPGLSALVVFVLTYSLFWADRYSTVLRETFEEESRLAASFVAPSLTEALWDFNDDVVASSLAGLEAIDSFTFAVVISDDEVSARNAIAEWNPAWDQYVETMQQEGDRFELRVGDLKLRRILLTRDDGETLVGELITAFSDAGITARLQQANMLAAAIGLVAFTAFATLLILSANSVSKPMRRIIAKLDELTAGDTNIDVPEASRGDELGQLGRAVLSFRDTLVQANSLEAQSAELRAGQEKVVKTLSDGLEQLARCNLAVTLADDFPEDHKKLGLDFAETVSRLRETISAARQNTEVIMNDVETFAETAVRLSKRSIEDSAQLRNAANAIDELTTSSQHTRDIATQARDSAGSAGSAVSDGETVIGEAIAAMDQIKSSSGEIASITDVIDEIAFQTNLLALNAGVEAARAGDAGRSFGIVATEVRALAQRTSEAAGQIKGLIKTSGDHVSHGVDMVAQSSGALEKILVSITEIREQVDDISGSAITQSDKLKQINGSISALDKRSSDNANALEATSDASLALREKSTSLLNVMDQFSLGRASNSFVSGRPSRSVA